MNTLYDKAYTVKEVAFCILGALLIASFITLYLPRFAAIRILPPVIGYLFDHLGRNWAIAANVGVFILFLLFLPYRTKIEWRSKGAFSAFILALIAEMFGIPLLVFILSPLVHISYYEAYVGGWLNNPRIFGWIGAVVGAWLTLIGMILVIIGWRQIHRATGLVTTGIYKYVRHPQYTGFFLIVTGWILHWETTLTLLMYPVLILMYFFLARREEIELKNGFGDEYEVYRQRTPMFFPLLGVSWEAMKRAGLILLLVLPWMILGSGEVREQQRGMSHEWHKAEVSNKAELRTKVGEAKQAFDTEAEMKGKSMESIQKKGDLRERLPGRNQTTPGRQQLTGAKFGAVDMKPQEMVIRTVGRVIYDDKRIVTVAPKISGKIEDVYVGFPGGYVRQGEPLLSIYSAEMVAAQEEYLLALRAKDEFSKSAFPEVARSGASLAESAKRHLKLWDISDQQIRTLEETRQAQKTLNVYAPESGYFLGNQAYKGMDVMSGSLFELADLSVVWVISDINEYDLPFVRVGQRAAIKLEAIPGETFTGKAIYVYPSDRETHTAKVRFEVSNPKGKLKPEMRADVEIKVNLGEKLAVSDGMITALPSLTESEARDAFVVSYDQTAYDTLIAQLSKKYKVDFYLIKAIIRMESGFNPYAVSRKGARGLMQLMPETAERMNVSNIFDPKENIEGGIRHLKYLASLFNNDLALSLAAYNAGEKMVTQFKGIPPYPETVDYVKKVMALYHSYKS